MTNHRKPFLTFDYTLALPGPIRIHKEVGYGSNQEVREYQIDHLRINAQVSAADIEDNYLSIRTDGRRIKKNGEPYVNYEEVRLSPEDLPAAVILRVRLAMRQARQNIALSAEVFPHPDLNNGPNVSDDN